MNLKKRVGALEEMSGSALRPWHRVVVENGQTEEAAIAAYEAEYGPIGEENVILRTYISTV